MILLKALWYRFHRANQVENTQTTHISTQMETTPNGGPTNADRNKSQRDQI